MGNKDIVVTHPLKILLAKKIRLANSHELFIKILSNTEIVNGRYVLCLPGGPGFGHSSMEPWALEIIKQLPDIHIILFDPLHCGISDKSTSPDTDFTLDNFAEIASQVVEAVCQQLQIMDMELYLFGGSFGSMTAMLMPAKRQEWIVNPQAIALKTIFSAAGPISWEAVLQSIDFVKKVYAEDPCLGDYLASMTKLYSGEIASTEDYINTIVVKLAQIYSNAFKGFSSSYTAQILTAHPKCVTGMLNFFKSYSDQARFMHEALSGCSIEVLNHFFANEFGKFNLLETINTNPELYQHLEVCLFSGINDHIAPPETNATLLREKLPNSIQINLNSKHSMSADGLLKPISTMICSMITGGPEFFCELINNNLFLMSHFIDSFSMAETVDPHAQYQPII